MAGDEHITKALEKTLEDLTTVQIKGRVDQVVGTLIKAVTPEVRIGELCILRDPWEKKELFAEVVGIHGKTTILTPMGELFGLSASSEVIPTGKMHQIPVGDGLLGRVLDGMGAAIDDKGSLNPTCFYPAYASPPNPLKRKFIERPLQTGLRAIDGLISCAEGQRIGIFAAPGVGKSTLISMLANGSDADVVVMALIGERGREVREFIEYSLGAEGLKKSIVVVSTSDRPAMERLKAVYTATAIAEYFRDQNKKVLLLMDSVTRYARALREIGLAAGEPPTRRGFPPSVFSNLPMLLERAGQSDKGSITAFYTVLIEGDDITDPVAEETQSLLDGHIILSRKLAGSGQYPAIDILTSISRVMNAIVDDRHKAAAEKMRTLISKYREIELLVQIGEYEKGRDPSADEAISKIGRISQFLCQSHSERSSLEETLEMMISICE